MYFREASFAQEFKEDTSVSENIRYFFPVGCTGIEVLIDNSSRLRSIAMNFPEHLPRLPVTLKPTTPASTYPVPPTGFLPPKPSSDPIPATKPPTAYLPPATTKPANTYLPPTNPTTKKPAATYLPPAEPTVTSRPPVKPDNTYLPVEKPSNVYLPAPNNSYLPPLRPSTASPPTLNPGLLPPAHPTDTCGSSLSCCEEAADGQIVIPIPLKNHGSSSCCGRVAKLILPIVGLDKESIRKLSSTPPEEIDATNLIKSILRNLL